MKKIIPVSGKNRKLTKCLKEGVLMPQSRTSHDVPARSTHHRRWLVALIGLLLTFGSLSTSYAAEDFVVLGEEGIWVREGSTVVSGDVGANMASAGPWLASDQEVTFGINVIVQDLTSRVMGDTMRLKSGTMVHDVFVNTLKGPGIIQGTLTTPVTLPLVVALPPVPSVTPGTQDFDVPSGGTLSLDAGNYGVLKARNGAVVTLTGGVYHFQSWNIRANAQVLAAAPVDIRVADHLETRDHVVVGPAPTAPTLTAADVVIIGTGINGTTGAINATPEAVRIGTDSTIRANMYVPNGLLRIRDNGSATGAFVGKWVRMGNGGTITLEGGFGLGPGGGNTPPVADAGFNQSVVVNEPFELNGSGSRDADGDVLTFAWTLESQPPTSTTTLTNSTEVLPTLLVDQPGDYVVQLIVNDGTDDSAPDTVTLSTGNLAPVANAGADQTVAVTQPAFLDGTGSTDANGDGLTYQWTLTNQPANSTATLNDPVSATPSFIVDQVGAFTVTLLVSDGLLMSEADLVIIATDNSAPVAHAGPDHSVRAGTIVPLDGTASNDADGNSLTYQWSQTVVPPGNTTSLSDPTAVSPTLTPDVEGDYVAQLQVNDGTVTSEPDTALIRVGNTAPIADAGPDQSVDITTTVQLDGANSSDPQGDPLTFLWMLTLPTGSGATLSDATIAEPTFDPDVEGTYAVTLTVNDGDLDSPSDSMTVFVTVTTPQPTISGFNPSSASIGDLITLTGTDFVSAAGEVGQVTLVQQGGGAIPATVTASSPTMLTFIVPSGAATGLMTVSVAGETVSSASPLTIVPSQTFDLAVEPGTVDVQQGQTVSVAIKATSTSGLTQLATLGVTGLPTGVTGTFQPPQITAGQTVMLTLTASSAQASGTTPFEVTATVNIEGLDVLQTGTGTLTVQPLTTSFLGRTVVANTLQTPLAGVTVNMLGQDGSGNATACVGQTVSDAAGNFALTTLPSECVGSQLIRYDGGTATSPPGQYAGVDLVYTIVADQATVSPVLIHLPRIDNAETIMVQQNHPTDQLVTFQTIPNLTATVYAGTIFTLLDGTQPNPFPLTAIQVPLDRLPDQMPPNTTTVDPFIVAFQPANARASQPVAVSFPNLLNTPPGTPAVTLTTLDPTQGVMVNYGTGTVSPDGLQIIPDLNPATPGQRFGLVHFDWHGPGQMAPPENPSNDNDHPECGDPIDLSSGILVIRATDLEISGGRGRIGIDRNYRSLTTAVGPFGIGTSHNYGHRLDTINPQGSTVINVIMPNGSFFSFTKQPDGTFTNTTIPAVRGAVLSVVANNEVDLRWKDGQVFHFVPGNFQQGSVLQSITDRNGNQTMLVRNANDLAQILEVIDPVGRSLTLTYDSSNRITSITDPINRTVQYTYNTQGTLETVTDPEGGVTRYDYNTQNQLTQITDARGIVVAQNMYDANGRVIEQTQADGGVLTFAYELLNPLVPLSPVQRTMVTDPRGNSFSYRFNPQGFVLSQTNALGQTTDQTIEPGTNLPMTTVDLLGRRTSVTNDARGNRTSFTDPDGQVTTIVYEPLFSLPTRITDPEGQVTELTYDATGNLTAFTNSLNETTTVSYNAFGQPTSVTDPLGQTSTVTYNLQGDRIGSSDPLGNQMQEEYDLVSRLSVVTDPRGFTTQSRFDRKDRVTQITDARGGVTQLAYDVNDQLLSHTDAKGQSTIFTYNTRNRLVTRTDALGRQESYAYDLNDNLIQFIDRKNQVTHFTYDDLNRRTLVTDDDGNTTTVSYNAMNRVIQMNHSVSGTISRTYDPLNRLVQETTPQGNLTYTYDRIGRRTAMATNGQASVTYAYDGASRLTQVAQGLQLVSLDYDAAGRRTRLTYPNGTSATSTYDAASRLIHLLHQGPTDIIDALTYTFDAADNRVSLNRMQTVASDLPAALDAAYDGANEQIQMNSATPNLTYDANGNLATRTIGTNTTTYTWNARNQLVAIDAPGSATTYVYDAVGRRVSKNVNGETMSYHYDGVDIVAEMREGATVARYLNSLTTDERFIRQTATPEYYHVDALGSAMALTDADGIVQARYSYDPFGKASLIGPTTNTFTYTGRQFDAESGLYFYRARYLDANTGRFLSEDPLRFEADDQNLYRYVFNNPINLNDPFGLTPRTPATGTPNSTQTFPDGRGGSTERHYGPDGRATKDLDQGHDHDGSGDPHAHDWDWSKPKPRQNPRPVTPGEGAGGAEGGNGGSSQFSCGDSCQEQIQKVILATGVIIWTIVTACTGAGAS